MSFDMQTINRKLYEKYIAPTIPERKSFIGIEIELPIVNLDRKPVDFSFVQNVTEGFIRNFEFDVTGRDDAGRIYAAENQRNGDILSYDCSFNNLELSMGKETAIDPLDERFRSYYSWLQSAFSEKNHMLTGMGVNPYRQYNHNVPIENERYRMLFHHLGTCDRYEGMYFHPWPQYGTFSSASQVQLDVRCEDLLKTIRVFSLLEPVKALLFSNSVLLGEREDLLCCRDMFWENSTHGINSHNIGMFERIPESIDELIDYIRSCSLYCVMRNGRYINFSPMPLDEYFSRSEIEGEIYDPVKGYHRITFHPEIEDLEYLRSFKFEDVTFRGTIEFRSCCCQPVGDAMTIPAFHVGLQNRLDELDELFAEDRVLYHRGYTPGELRKWFNQGQVPGMIHRDELYALVQRILDLASDGLKDRGFGEERYLRPLYDRAGRRSNPAADLLAGLANGESLESVIRKYGSLEEHSSR